ncbi:hypothetical protein E2C01_095223 [Portunus trituberculatus]|uniref:Uncharacterized protein n=1 Tax=Portunus trituberculatus TaxID=210409 RepID=A0A5B7JZM3_PORTR|nr:hypothetical protein [Portunus trituberculatus]
MQPPVQCGFELSTEWQPADAAFILPSVEVLSSYLHAPRPAHLKKWRQNVPFKALLILTKQV